MTANWEHKIVDSLQSVPLYQVYGRVTKVIGLTVESLGPHAKLNELCEIQGNGETACEAEVVGFRDNHLILMPVGGLTSIAPGADVRATHAPLQVNCGSFLLGRIVDALGHPLDDGPPLADGTRYTLDGQPPHPLKRQRVLDPMQTGVRAIDSLLTVGRGQRVGIFAGSGVGKSTLLSMIAKKTTADVNVIALIGERGREVREFIERDLGEDGLARSVVVVATSDQPALLRIKAALTATAIAEYFRDQGAHVNLMMDSVTRFAMAQREIGLAVGEPPTSRGYTPSVFAVLPRLLERSGAGVDGTITAFYTVLVDGDDLNDPIADTVRGILDGHIVLSRSLANRGHFPAIDVLLSISRLFSVLADSKHQEAAYQFREWLHRYQEVEDLLRIGAYQRGVDRQTDMAIDKYQELVMFLRQREDEPADLQATLNRLVEVVGGSFT